MRMLLLNLAANRLDRQRTERVLMAAIALFAVERLRVTSAAMSFFLTEIGLIALCAGLCLFGRLKSYAAAALVAVPLATAIVGRWIGQPIAFELTALTLFGTASLAIALVAQRDRTRAMSVVASGFLTLFATSISDAPNRVAVTIVWMLICVWHLVANHWERLELCAAENVRRGRSVRPVSAIAAVLVFAFGGWIARDRFTESQPLQFGLMPTSGGNQWSDPAARSGVGTGEAAIAAKQHADSFGAVDSEIFLESTQPTLYDMFSDSIGPPRLKFKWERRQSVNMPSVIQSHQQMPKSEQGGNQFSLDRLPPKEHRHLTNVSERAAFQWAGPTGIRLAVQRYDTYQDGTWSQSSASGVDKLARRDLQGSPWFFHPDLIDRALADQSVQVGQIKMLHFDSTRLPSPMMTAGLHIKDIDRQDFFGIDQDGSYFMPGRDKVPPLTVIHMASLGILEDELWKQLDSSPLPQGHGLDQTTGRGATPLARADVLDLRSEDPAIAGASANAAGADESREPLELESYARRLCAGIEQPYAQLQAIVAHLRNEFTLDRQQVAAVGDPIGEFLRTRRGGDHLFASTAALLANELGFRTRLVTGFYVRPDAVDRFAGHANVLPEDVHCWLEVKLDDNRWFELEPTPGYLEPVYTASLWLRSQQFLAANWPILASITALIGIGFWTRMFWLEVLLRLSWLLSFPLPARRRLRLAMWILETRGSLAGTPRLPGRPQRDWLLGLTQNADDLARLVRQVCDLADQVVWNSGRSVQLPSLELGEMVRRMSLSYFQNVDHEVAG